MIRPRVAFWLGLVLLATPLHAQDASAIPADVQKMLTEGQTEALEARFHGGTAPQEYEWLARGYTTRARKLQKNDEREKAFAKAADYFTKWTATLDKTTGGGALAETQRVAAHVDFGAMILSSWIARDLDEYEITAGLRGDRAALLGKLRQAVAQYDAALKALQPMVDDQGRPLANREDEYFAANVFDTVRTLWLDSTLNRSWASYYVGVLEVQAPAQTAALGQAEKGFRMLIDSGRAGQMIYQCYLALGMTLREQGRYEDALRTFTENLPLYDDPKADPAAVAAVEIAIRGRARYEVARVYLEQEKFTEARQMLAPLAQKDARDLPNELKPAAFYFNLAAVADANSYLQEARKLRKQAAGDRSARALLNQADRARDQGLMRLQTLSNRGGSWPAVVSLYISASIDRNADPADLTPIELLYSARDLAATGSTSDAIKRLNEARDRKDVEVSLMADILFELGVTQYKVGDWRAAAADFDLLASDAAYKTLPRAPQAATNAYKVRVEIAKDTSAPDDYGALADTLQNLLATFADHPQRRDAEWDLPIALQQAGRVEAALAEFRKVAQASPHWEEAQFRAALCARQAVEQQRGTLDDAQFKQQAQAAADELKKYADEALKRAGTNAKAEARRWAAEAQISAAELLATPRVDEYQAALEMADAFDKTFPDSSLAGRLIGVRIRAYRGLRQFDRAAQLLDEFLKSVPADRVGAVLASLAAGMQQEAERLYESGQTAPARELATAAIPTFEQLDKWVTADASRAANVPVVKYGLAQMYFFAGDSAKTDALLTAVLKDVPRNGNYLRLRAKVLTAQLGDNPSKEQLQAAQIAWEELLKDQGLRQKAPTRFWEAQTAWLTLVVRAGDKALAARVIREVHVWNPDLGGPPWRERIQALWEQVGNGETLGPTTAPTTAPAASQPA
jgi:hypothetical protein